MILDRSSGCKRPRRRSGRQHLTLFPADNHHRSPDDRPQSKGQHRQEEMQQMVHSATLHDHRLGVRPGLDPPTFAHVLRNELVEANAPNREARGCAASGVTAEFAELCLVG
jgi:hypothetical protein